MKRMIDYVMTTKNFNDLYQMGSRWKGKDEEGDTLREASAYNVEIKDFYYKEDWHFYDNQRYWQGHFDDIQKYWEEQNHTKMIEIHLQYRYRYL